MKQSIKYKIEERSDSLFTLNSIEIILLKPIETQSDHFNSNKLLLGNFVFERDENGKLTGFTLKQKSDNKLKFNKTEHQ